MIRANILAKPVSINNGVWSSKDKKVEQALNDWMKRETETATISHPLFFSQSPVDPYSDMTIALYAVKVWAGELLDKEIPVGELDFNPDVVY